MEISAAVGALRTLRRLERAVGTQALSRRILQHADCVSSSNVVSLARALQREQATLDRFRTRQRASGGRGGRGGRGEQELLARVFRDWLTKCLGRKWELAAEEMAVCRRKFRNERHCATQHVQIANRDNRRAFR